jgi:peptide/nickel transport system substrate-binding protein
VAKDPQHNHYWFPPINNINIWFNTTLPPFNNKLVRQAIAYSIDRDSVSKKGESGYEPPGNQTGVLSPTFDSWIDKSQADKFGYKFDVNKAQSLLQGPATRRAATALRGLLGPQAVLLDHQHRGVHRLGGLSAGGSGQSQAGGNQIKPDNLDSQAYFDKLFTGNFQLAYGSVNTSPGPNPYYGFVTLHSATTAAIGQTAAGNYGRYKNPNVDTLFDQFGATTDSAKQHDLMKQVENAMLDDVPVIPVTEGVAWYQYSTKDFAGWPTKDDPFAAPAPWNLPDWEVTLLHLYKKS